MVDLDEIANDPKWKPASDEDLASLEVFTNTHFGRTGILKVAVKSLPNGFLYATAQDNSGRNVLRNGDYPIEEFPELPNNGSLAHLDGVLLGNTYGFFANFEYEAGRTPIRLPSTILEYHTWHNPNYGDNGLILLTHLHATQEQNGENVEIYLSSAQRKKPNDRSLTLQLYSGDDRLIFDKEGRLLSTSIGVSESIKQLNHPLRDIYLATNNGARIDIQGTAEALVKATVEMENFNIVKMIKYDSKYIKPRML